jgi:hypothetical protein
MFRQFVVDILPIGMKVLNSGRGKDFAILAVSYDVLRIVVVTV